MKRLEYNLILFVAALLLLSCTRFSNQPDPNLLNHRWNLLDVTVAGEPLDTGPISHTYAEFYESRTESGVYIADVSVDCYEVGHESHLKNSHHKDVKFMPNYQIDFGSSYSFANQCRPEHGPMAGKFSLLYHVLNKYSIQDNILTMRGQGEYEEDKGKEIIIRWER